MTTRTVSEQRAVAGEPLLTTLAGVAELAQVSRPVASMWRKRFSSGDDAFPSAVTQVGGVDAFDALEVAEWLERTDHGNNPEVKGDAAAQAAPADLSFSDPGAVAEIEALVALSTQVGALGTLTAAALRNAVAEADPHDDLMRREVEAHADRGAPWLDYVDRLIDAAYSAPAALTLIAKRSTGDRLSAGSAGRLAPDAIALVVETVRALADPDVAVTLDAQDVALSTAVAHAVGDDATLSVPAAADARRVRRQALAEGLWLVDADDAAASRSVTVARVPAHRDDDIATMLRAVDDVVLTLRDEDAAVVIGPARALTDALTPADDQVRSDVLRTGRVRGVARLAPGLVDSAPREALALWVLGAPMGQVPIAERFTVVADLTDTVFTPAARADLVSDVVASMGSAREVRAHAFRFARFARTATLLARGGSLVATTQATAAPTKQSAHETTASLAARIDAAADAVRADLTPIPVAPTASPSPSPASVADLIRDGHLRMVAGTRLDPDVLGDDGLVVVTASDLDRPAAIGDHRVDQLAFATQHPSATLTRPGDVIFRTSPSAAAWVDGDGSKVVAYPARILRITAGDAGGLVPEVVAVDIPGQAFGPGAWKRWTLRRVAPHAIVPLRQALAAIAAARSDLQTRAARVDEYADLIVAGVTSGAVSMIDSTTAAVAASEQ